MNRTLELSLVLLGASLSLLGSSKAPAETFSTLRLDALSYVSFGDEKFLLPSAGSSIRFRFSEAVRDGSIPFTIRPEDVAIDPISVPDGGGTLTYTLVQPASGVMRRTPEGRRIDFTATVRATLDSDRAKGSFEYTIPFTTEVTRSTSADGAQTLGVAGMRIVDGAWYGQIVGATTNRRQAFPEPGAAVYTVLSGSFDRLPRD